MFENIVIYDGFDIEQSKQIKLGEDKNLKVYKYKNPSFDYRQMEQIRLGLEEDLNVDVYAKPIFVADQMFQIRKGLKDTLDVSVYADPSFAADQMWQLRMGLLDGLNVSKFADPKFSAKDMERFRRDETEYMQLVKEIKALRSEMADIKEALNRMLYMYPTVVPKTPLTPCDPPLYPPTPVTPWYVTCDDEADAAKERAGLNPTLYTAVTTNSIAPEE